VDKDTLLKEIWPDTFVEEGSLAQNISTLRRVLTEGRDGKELIETIPKRGYRFIAAVKEITPEDASRGSSQESPPALVSRLGVWSNLLLWVAPLGLAALIAVAYFTWHHYSAPPRFASRRMMLAVLPFENLSGDSAQEFFSDGMTEEMITQLGQMYPKHLGVIARTSAMQYKHAQKSAAQIGRDLRVDYILEGSTRRTGERVRISAQLIDVRDQTHLWAHSYERDLQDILSVQATVARDVAEEIGIRLVPADQADSTGARLVKPEAYEAYLRGRYYLNSATSEQGLQNAINEFERAIAADGRTALAYAGLANSYAALSDSYKPPREVLPRAKISAQKALELDPNLSEAHAALGWTALAFDWNWSLAGQELRRAIVLNPGNALAHDLYANYLAASGQHSEALTESQRALELDPFSVSLNANRGWYLILAHQFDAAIEQERRALDLDPTSSSCRAFLAMAYAGQRRFREALVEARHANSAAPSVMDMAAMASVLATSGARTEAEQLLNQLRTMMKQRYVCPYETAAIYVGLGKKNDAFQWLEKGYESRESCMIYLKTDPTFDPLRSDPRLSDLLGRVGFPSRVSGDRRAQ
jgi:TolB-like protein/Tfp pilus assembly protein PilF